MEFLASLFSGFAQAANSAAKGLDDAMKMTGAPTFVQAMTSSVVGVTESLVNASEGGVGSGPKVEAPSTASADGPGFLSRLMGTAPIQEPELAAGKKLGNNADLHNGTLAKTELTTPWCVDPSAPFQVPATQNLVQSGMGLSNAG